MTYLTLLFCVILFLPDSIGKTTRRHKNNTCDFTPCEVGSDLIQRVRAINNSLQKLTKLEHAITGLRVEIDTLMSSNTGDPGDALEKRLTSLETSSELATNKSEKMETTLTTLDTNIKDFNESLEGVRNKQDIHDENLNNTKLQLSGINTTISRSISNLNTTFMAQKANNKHVINLLQGMINSTNISCEEKITNLNDALSTLNSTIYSRSDIRILEVNISNLERTVTDQNHIIKSLNASLYRLISDKLASDAKNSQTACWWEFSAENGIEVTLDGEKLHESTSVTHGKTITYQCTDDAFKLEGISERTCEFGTWNEYYEPHCTDSDASVTVGKEVKFGTASQPCPELTGTFRDKDDCTKFYLCSQGHPPEHQGCPNSTGTTYFDTEAGQCEWEKPTNCP